MDEHCLRSPVHGRACELDVVAHAVVPAQSNLDGHRRTAHCPPHRLDDAADSRRLTRQRSAHAFSREVIDRTSEVDIDEIGAAGLGQRGRPRHFLGVRARQLDAETRLAGKPANEGELRFPLLLQTPGDRHLADQHAGAELDGESPVGQVGALRHRPHDHGAGQRLAQAHALLTLSSWSSTPQGVDVH